MVKTNSEQGPPSTEAPPALHSWHHPSPTARICCQDKLSHGRSGLLQAPCTSSPGSATQLKVGERESSLDQPLCAKTKPWPGCSPDRPGELVTSSTNMESPTQLLLQPGPSMGSGKSLGSHPAAQEKRLQKDLEVPPFASPPKGLLSKRGGVLKTSLNARI